MIKHVKQGVTLPPIVATLNSVTNSTVAAIDLTGQDVFFVMRHSHNTGVIIRTQLEAAEITDPANGEIQYNWRDDDTAIPGDYLVEFDVDDPATGAKQSLWDLRTAAQIRNEDNPVMLTIKVLQSLG